MSVEVAGPQRPAGRARALSAGEFAFGALIVIGHNVFRLVPNEVPILALLAIASMRLREGSWRWGALGFRRPKSWSRIVLIALGAAALRLLLGTFVIEPLTSHFWPPIKGPAVMNDIRGHVTAVLMYLPIIWGFAGFGEEIGYRGYLLNKLAEALGCTRTASVIAILGSAVLFGFGHYYKGPAGVLDSGIAGVILGTVYLISGRNLWACILTHGFIDTAAVLAAFFGWSD